MLSLDDSPLLRRWTDSNRLHVSDNNTISSSRARWIDERSGAGDPEADFARRTSLHLI